MPDYPVIRAFFEGNDRKNGKLIVVSKEEQMRRVEITERNAEEFWKLRDPERYHPVAVIQHVSIDGAAEQMLRYYDMGYRHIAVGGIGSANTSFFMQEGELSAALKKAKEKLKPKPWLHIFGLGVNSWQELRDNGVNSFDTSRLVLSLWMSKSRGFWNPFSEEWHPGLRIPSLRRKSSLYRKKLLEANEERLPGMEVDVADIVAWERKLLLRLDDWDLRGAPDGEVFDLVEDIMAYYSMAIGKLKDYAGARVSYQHLLESKPWRKCGCPFCQRNGVHQVISNTTNNFKSAGMHNSLCWTRMIDGKSPLLAKDLGRPAMVAQFSYDEAEPEVEPAETEEEDVITTTDASQASSRQQPATPILDIKEDKMAEDGLLGLLAEQQKEEESKARLERMTILGVDPGLTRCGWALVEAVPWEGSGPPWAEFVRKGSGTIETDGSASKMARLADLDRQLGQVAELERDCVAIERTQYGFGHHMAGALQAAGVCLLRFAAGEEDAKIPLVELSASTVKKMVAGHGKADKKQVAEAVQHHCGAWEAQHPDERDAVAVAIAAYQKIFGLDPLPQNV